MAAIGIVIRELIIGGAEKQCLLLAKALQANHKVILIIQKDVGENNRNHVFIEENNIRTELLKGNLLSRIRKTLKLIRKEKIELLITYLPIDNVLGGAVRLLNHKIKLIDGVRSSLLPGYKLIPNRWVSKYLAARTVFNNESGLRSFTEKGYPKNKSVYIHNYTEINNEPPVRTSSKITRIISVGRYIDAKDYKTAIWGIKNLSGHYPDGTIHYTIIGFGELEKKIRQWISESGCNTISMVNNPDNLEAYYREADIYLCSSVFEGLSNTLLEALEFGLPVVATNVGDNYHLVQENITGFIVPAKDYHKIAEKLRMLVDSPEMRREFGVNGFKLLQRKFNKTLFTSRYEELIREVLNTS